jgi:hypothetical protein
MPHCHAYHFAGTAAAAATITAAVSLAVPPATVLLLLQEPGRLMSGIYVREPDSPKAPELYVTAAVTEQQYQQVQTLPATQQHQPPMLAASDTQ